MPESRPSAARKQQQQQYSDRFIPSRRGINLQDSFALLPDSQQKKRDAPQEGAKDDNLDTYTMLLRSEFLGSEPNSGRRGDEMSPVSPQRNLFRYRLTQGSRIDENSAYALSPVGSDSQRVLCSPRKAPRKISTVPYKVLDAPALQDDFYLNLVDWSSLNVLAVGLGTCVYLWSACTSKVTKLCDLGPEDSVRASFDKSVKPCRSSLPASPSPSSCRDRPTPHAPLPPTSPPPPHTHTFLDGALSHSTFSR
jgi:cell division cycle 20-like protein 1 (cofactor of APC complex)